MISRYFGIFLLILIIFKVSITESLGLSGSSLLPSDDQCGKVRPAPRVIGGHNAKLGQFPWSALIYASRIKVHRKRPAHLTSGSSKSRRPLSRISQRLSKYEIICGGSIVSDRFIVSAAHCCTHKTGKKMLYVRVGEHDLDSTEDCEAGSCAPPPQDIAVERYVTHEDFDPVHMNHDICLILLQQPISFNDFVVPICLPTSKELQNKDFSGTNLEVAGWGVKEFDKLSGIRASVLQTTTIPVLPLSKCKDEAGHQVMMSPTLCVGGEKGRDSCSGDSGGPLMAKLNDTSIKYFLIGVVSYGEGSCTGNMPAVYVDVPKYVGWIINNMELLLRDE